MKFHYIYFGEKDDEILDLLKARSLQELQVEKIDDDDRKKELAQSYIELVGSLGREYDSVYWWANFLPSKNKFISRLFPNLLLFYSLITALNNNANKNILIINPSPEIYASLLKYCRANSINLRILPDHLKKFRYYLANIRSRSLGPVLFLFSTWRKIYLSRKYLGGRFSSRIERNGKYYVLRSWFYPGTINAKNEYVDSFFGQLPQYLLAQGIRLLVIAGDQGDYKVIARKIAEEKNSFIVTQEYFLKYTDPVSCLFSTLLRAARIKDKVSFRNLDVTDIVKEEVCSFNKYSVMTEYLHSYYLRRMLNYLSIDTFATTYENNPWERVCFWTLRKYSPQTRIIGYQHSVLSQAHVNMLLGTEERNIVPMPDKVITIGKVTRDILVNRGNYNPGMVKEGCGLRFAHIFKLRERGRHCNFNILVTPEGVLSESVNLFEIVNRALADQKQYKIRLRPHPALPFPRIREHLSFDIKATPNIHVSQNVSSEKDLEEVDIVIYRGSSLCIEALKVGIPVIYVSLDSDILSVDPLFECSYLKWSVKNESELRDAVAATYGMSEREYKDALFKARNYLDDYVHPITEECLEEFLK